jgi:hypothetical protein
MLWPQNPSTSHLVALEIWESSQVYTKRFVLRATKKPTKPNQTKPNQTNSPTFMMQDLLFCTMPTALNVAGLSGAGLHRG